MERITAGDMSARPPISNRREWVRLALCASVLLLGVLVIFGWLRGVEPLKSVVPGLPTMKFNTATAIALVGIGLAAANYRAAFWRFVAILAGGAAAGIGLLTILQYATGFDLGIDQLIVTDTGTLIGSGHPGRMSWLTATAWLALGPAIITLALGESRRSIAIAHILIGYAGFVSVLAVAGHTFGAEQFWGIGFYTQIAVHTAAGLGVAVVAGLMTRAGQGWLEPYTDSPAARSMLVRLLPLSLAVPVGLGLLLMLGAGLGAFNAAYAFAVFIPATGIAMIVGSLWIARKQREAEILRLQYERHLQLLVGELNHRVKNTLAIVQSLAHQSLSDQASPAEAKAAFVGRLQALAAAHNMLTSRNWDNLPLDQLLRGVLAAHGNVGQRFQLDGPSIELSPKASVTMAIAAHELATNATKYGALSGPSGRVRISWSNDDGQFRFRWQESGGPNCEPPAADGFGTKMLKRALASEMGGTARLDFAPDGLTYELVGPPQR
jgi:two-component sensor histidine kinase